MPVLLKLDFLDYMPNQIFKRKKMN